MWDENQIFWRKKNTTKNSVLYAWEKFILFQNRNSNSEWEENTPAANKGPSLFTCKTLCKLKWATFPNNLMKRDNNLI